MQKLTLGKRVSVGLRRVHTVLLFGALFSGSVAHSDTPVPPQLYGEGAIHTGKHAHFDYLRSNPHTQVAASLRTQTEVEKYHHGKYDDDRWRSDSANQPFYDSVEDAEKWPMVNGKVSYSLGQARVPVETSNPARSLFYWEAKWDASYPNGWDDPRHKAFQLRQSGNVNWTITERYSPLRTTWQLRSPWNTPESDQAPPSEFRLHFGVWTRYWYYIDMEKDEVHVWMADEGRPIPRYLGQSYDVSFEGDRSVSEFIFEWNVSANQPSSGARPVWGRNFVHVKDISFENAKALVEHETASQFD